MNDLFDTSLELIDYSSYEFQQLEAFHHTNNIDIIEALKEYNIKTISVANLNEAIEKLENKEVDAVVYDRPQLLHFLKNNGEEGLHIAKAEYYKQGYGFAFPLHSPLVYDVNRALLELAEDQETERIINYYLDKDE